MFTLHSDMYSNVYQEEKIEYRLLGSVDSDGAMSMEEKTMTTVGRIMGMTAVEGVVFVV